MTPWVPIGHRWSGEPVPAEAVARIRWSLGDVLRVEVDAPFHDDPAPAGPPGSVDALWNHEVVELFLLGTGERYLEIELGPRGHYLVLQLAGVRQPTAMGLPIQFRATIHGDRWQGVAEVPSELVPAGVHRFNAYRIHGQGDGRTYLAHAPTKGDAPDFHRLEAFRPLP